MQGAAVTTLDPNGEPIADEMTDAELAILKQLALLWALVGRARLTVSVWSQDPRNAPSYSCREGLTVHCAPGARGTAALQAICASNDWECIALRVPARFYVWPRPAGNPPAPV